MFQGAGLIAWQDIDNYVRAGLTFVGELSPSGVAIETDVESDGDVRRGRLRGPPGSTAETLRLKRAGDTVTTAPGTAPPAWVDVSTVDVTFEIERVGLYALAAQDGTTYPAVFDDVRSWPRRGDDVVPTGPFTLRAPATPRT